MSAIAPTCGTNKEIRWFKLAINTACPLRCDYCFIDKDSGEVMPLEVAEGAIDFMMNSPGQIKQLFIYGGEPFLEFELVRRITLVAETKARRLAKTLDLAICTSGVCVSRGQMEFLREHNYFLSVSIDGSQGDHDRHRVLKGGQATWSRIVRNLPMMIAAVGSSRAMAIQCVHPDNVQNMLANFQALTGLGFRNVEIEIIHGFGWTQAQKEQFRPMMQEVLDWIWAQALEGRHYFLGCSLGPVLDWQAVQKQKDMCPFYCTMEVYPDGNYSFYPFPFVSSEGRRLSAVGSVAGGLEGKYRGCSFDPASPQCQGCTRDYYRDPSLNDGNEPYHWRTRMARAFMEKVALAARSDPRIRAYFTEAVARRRIGTV